VYERGGNGDNTMIESQKCPECGDNHFFVNKERGEMICRTCSLVIDDSMVDFGKDTRSFDSTEMERKSRTGAVYDPRVANNLMTQIGTSADIAKLPAKTKHMIKRIREKHNWVTTGIESNLNNALSNLQLMASSLKLPEKVEKEAAMIYRTCAERGLTKARPSEHILVACIYIACKTYDMPKSIKEIAEGTNINIKTIGKVYKFLMRKLGMKIGPSNPVDYVGKFASELDLSAVTQSKAVELIEEAQKKGCTSGHSPISLAAAALYLSALKNGERRTQKEISDATNVTEVTLRNRYRELSKKLKFKVKVR
jgi:transcription initiation factor TFIIB